MISSGPATSLPSRIEIGGLGFDAVAEDEVIATVRNSWVLGQGGSIIPVNVDVARAASLDPELTSLVGRAALVVADGMPLVWAAAIRGTRLPERVAGSSLIYPLSQAACADGRSLFIFGGAPGVPEGAADALVARYPGLRIAGTLSPEFGFDRTAEGTRQAIAQVTSAAPDLVYVGLGFPRQERIIEALRREMPSTWYLACGGGIAMAAGITRRAAPAMQRLGLEWVHRLALEPRRLARRYLHDDLPFALRLLARAAVDRVTGD